MKNILRIFPIILLICSLSACSNIPPQRVRITNLAEIHQTNGFYGRYMDCLSRLRNQAFKQELIKELCNLENL